MNCEDSAVLEKEEYDVLVVGSGAAGLLSALVAARGGANVLVVEKSALLGGTTAISGGQVWVPGNPHMERIGCVDSVEDSLTYLQKVTLGSVEYKYLTAFVEHAPEMVKFIERESSLRFFAVNRPDYHPEWDGAHDGRSLEPLPYKPTEQSLLRKSRYRTPVTSVESRQSNAAELATSRKESGELTQGAALVAGLVDACIKAGVELRVNTKIADLISDGSRVTGARLRSEQDFEVSANAVVLAAGGFEWNASLAKAFFGVVPQLPISPPSNEGDALLAAMKLGAGLTNMAESWWTAAVTVPGELDDGAEASRNIVRELALPGSILINSSAQRFVNEASSYNDLGKAFLRFDTTQCEYPNAKAWLVFDAKFKDRYNVVTVPSASDVPEWIVKRESIRALATAIGVSSVVLHQTIQDFNEDAVVGVDSQFARGRSRHDRFYGDSGHQPNPCLATLDTAPYYALPVFLGNLGTKGGLTADVNGSVLRQSDGKPIEGLYACGNNAASWMGLGYPGAGGSLGPILTASYLCGKEISELVTLRNRKA